MECIHIDTASEALGQHTAESQQLRTGIYPAHWTCSQRNGETGLCLELLSISTKLRIYTPRACCAHITSDWKRLDSFHLRCQRRILHISWHDFVTSDEVLHRTGLFDVSYIVRKRRLDLFGHVARLRSDVPANSILRICAKTRDGERPSQEWRRTCGRP